MRYVLLALQASLSAPCLKNSTPARQLLQLNKDMLLVSLLGTLPRPPPLQKHQRTKQPENHFLPFASAYLYSQASPRLNQAGLPCTISLCN